MMHKIFSIFINAFFIFYLFIYFFYFIFFSATEILDTHNQELW